MPSLSVTCLAGFGWYPWEACSLLKGKGEGEDLWEERWVDRLGGGEERGEPAVGMQFMRKEQINKIPWLLDNNLIKERLQLWSGSSKGYEYSSWQQKQRVECKTEVNPYMKIEFKMVMELVNKY